MAVASQFIDRFSFALGLKPMTLEGYLRSLRVAGLSPVGGRGGGKSAAHFTDEHIKNGILALVGPQPSDGPDAVFALDRLIYAQHRSTNRLPMMPDHSRRFGEAVRLAIVRLLDPAQAKACREDIVARDVTGEPGCRITMCLNPLWACITTPQGKGAADLEEWFLPPDRELLGRPAPMGWRPFVIDTGLLLVAAELLADTLARRPTSLPTPDPSPGRLDDGNVTPETTKASGTGIHEGLQSNEPAFAAQTESISKTQSNGRQGSKQLGSKPTFRTSQAGSSTRTRKEPQAWPASD